MEQAMNLYRFLPIFLLVSTLSAANFQLIEHFTIQLEDGTRLATRMWLPNDHEKHPVPAILNYLPYRKRDGTRVRDDPMMSWYAANGYAVLRVDMRGTGESDGLLEDEYLEIEQNDALEIIHWIANQPWCSGSVGIMGKSWGGFNALQIAAKRPPALKAVLAVCSTDDRYADDIHYMGGCLLNDNLWWGAIMVAYQARPPDPSLKDDWKEEWMERIQKMPFWPALWMKHQRRDEYWKQGSICEDWRSIECPVFAVGGWGDAYTNTIPRMLENLHAPCLGLIGPWAHVYPQDGVPGPAIGFMQETLRWWDLWLKGQDTGIMNEPMLRAYLEEWSPPSGWRDYAPGAWVGEDSWPSANIEKQKLFLSASGLSKKSDQGSVLAISSPQWTGVCGGDWMGSGVRGEMPIDQRFDDGCSLTFDTPSFTQPIQILGAPEMVLWLSSDKPIANLCARLCDIAPDGSSRRLSFQVLNLTHRNSHEIPEYLVPGDCYEVRIKLNDCGYTLAANHRLRIALSTAYWPLIWPSPYQATLHVHTQKSFIEIPVRKPRLEDTFVRFEMPTTGQLASTTLLRSGRLDKFFAINLLNDTATYIVDGKEGIFGEGVYCLEGIGTSLAHSLKKELFISKEDPLSARQDITQTYLMEKDSWKVRIDSSLSMTCSESRFYVKGFLDVYENEKPFAHRVFDETIERDHL